ncbi:hypothetical protein BC832DRAFT_399158 [Gaertneriomyces semiglobifer]|nr:hypothetical protein BC832DRAFT_399158 [Gaertneriomyces semiglobifer]
MATTMLSLSAVTTTSTITTGDDAGPLARRFFLLVLCWLLRGGRTAAPTPPNRFHHCADWSEPMNGLVNAVTECMGNHLDPFPPLSVQIAKTVSSFVNQESYPHDALHSQFAAYLLEQFIHL